MILSAWFIYVSYHVNINLPLSEHTLVNNPLYKLRSIPLYGSENPISDQEFHYKVSPDNQIYFFTRLSENIDLITGKKTLIDISNIRIKELDYALNGKIPLKSSPVNYLVSILTEYKKTISKEIHRLDLLENNEKNIEIVKLYYLLQDHHLKTNRVIYELKDNGAVKKTLYQHADALFLDLLGNLKTKTTLNDLNSTNYTFDELLKSKEYGLYDVLVKKSEVSPYFESVQLKNANVVHSSINQVTIPEESDQENYYIFSNIRIDRSSQFITLLTHPYNIIPPSNWLQLKKADNYEYSKSFPWLYSADKYVFKVKLLTSTPITIRLDDAFDDKTLVWNENVISPYNGLPIETNIVRTKNHENAILTLKIISSTPLSAEKLTSLQMEMIPIINPQITLSRNQYQPNKEQSFAAKRTNPFIYQLTIFNYSDSYMGEILNQLADSPWKKINTYGISSNTKIVDFVYIQGLLSVILFSISFFTVFLIFLRFLFKRYFFYQYQKFEFLFISKTLVVKKLLRLIVIFIRTFIFYCLNLVKLTCQKYRLILLVCSFTIIFICVLNQSFSRDDIIALFTATWLMTIIAYEIQSNVSFILAFIFLSLTVVFLTLKSDIRAEIFATWSYFFLIAGSLTLIMETLSHSYKSLNLYETAKVFVNDLDEVRKQNIFTKILFVIVSFSIKIVTILLAFFIKETTRIIEKFYDIKIPHLSMKISIPHRIITDRKILKRFIVRTFVLIVTITILLLIHVQITSYFNFKKQFPVITQVQPSIVYYANRIIIKGSNFGTSQSEKLNSDIWGEIKTDYWSKEKIILTVPLGWNIGKGTMWIEKTINWNNKLYYLKSDVVTIKLLPRSNSWSKDDDEYLKQEEGWEAETRDLNK